ncbi:hypothetical protein KC19_11G087400, partial [Ceratodon purpureus]
HLLSLVRCQDFLVKLCYSLVPSTSQIQRKLGPLSTRTTCRLEVDCTLTPTMKVKRGVLDHWWLRCTKNRLWSFLNDLTRENLTRCLCHQCELHRCLSRNEG